MNFRSALVVPRLAIVGVLVAAVAAGCGAASATKAGKHGGPVVLRIATRDVDLVGEPPIAYFVRRVGQLSGGTMRIDVAGFWGSGRAGAEQEIVRAVATGSVDLGAAGTRVFDTLGVSSMEALTAPMLIDSYPLERAVIASDVPRKMLPGLDKLGVTGLAVVGEWLRKPVAVKRPLLEPADWRGITFAAFRSRAAAASIRALGARPSDVWGSAQSAALGDGRLEGAENDLGTYIGSSRQEQAPYVTANVNLWPRTTAVIANTKRFSRLTSEQQGWLRQAAADAASRSTGMFDQDGQITAALCKLGAHISNATEQQLAALRRALEPVYVELERDPQTKAFVARIEQLKRSTPRGPALRIPAGCAGHSPVPRASASTGDLGALNGTYRFVVSDAELKANGVTGAFVISQNHGIFTWVLHDGRWRIHQQANNKLFNSCNGNFGGRYRLKGDLITVEPPPSGTCASTGGSPITARWKLADGQLRFTVVGAADPTLRTWFTAHPWKRIG
jgi:TRAP-type C4-dicarboxylate transport system substrate-binding protein